MGPLKEEITERAGMMLAMNAPKAAFGIVDVLDDPSAMGALNATSAAREVLDRTGLVKKEKVEVTANTSGMFFFTSKNLIYLIRIYSATANIFAVSPRPT